MGTHTLTSPHARPSTRIATMVSMNIKTPPGSMAKTPAPQSMRTNYSAYKSPFGPQYKTGTHFHGLTSKAAMKYGMLAGGFGGVAGIFAIFFFAEVPRVR